MKKVVTSQNHTVGVPQADGSLKHYHFVANESQEIEDNHVDYILEIDGFKIENGEPLKKNNGKTENKEVQKEEEIKVEGKDES